MSFQQGLSGLNAAAKNLDIIGNNVSNSNTIGYKGSSAQFADVYASSLAGAGGNNVGIGTSLASVQQTFAQGNINVSNNPLDIAINGQGFYRMSTNGAISFARNGQFLLDKSGYVVNSNGSRLTGFAADANGVIATASPTDIQLSVTDLAPKATVDAKVQMNLDARVTKMSAAGFDPTDTTTYNNATSMSVYDSQGNAHTLSMYFIKTDSNTWQVMATQDGKQTGAAVPAGTTGPLPAFTTTAGGTYTLSVGGVVLENAVAAPVNAAAIDAAIAANAAALTAAGITSTGNAVAGTLRFAAANGAAVTASETLGAGATGGGFLGGSAAGTLSASYNTAYVSGIQPVGTVVFLPTGLIDTTLSTPLPLSMSTSVTTGATSPMAFTLDLSGSTQFGSAFGVNSIDQDGYASGRLSGFATDANGVILGRYSNGQSRPQGQIVLANFTNPNGLQPMGANGWMETPASGAPLVGAPNTGSLGVLQAGALEDSNIDLTAELVNMITAQRIYQANAQTIKTQDQVLQTLVNLR
jgi:flagellar hook protein FlgE